MSTVANVKDIEQLQSAIHTIRADDAGVNRCGWVLVGHVDNNTNLIDVVDQGEDMAEFKEKLQDDQVMYALLRYTTTFDMSTTVKFVYLRWIGENVAAIKKGRYGVVHGSVQEHFTPFHLQLETGTLEEISDENIIEKLDESSGTRSKVIEGSIAGRQERGFTQHAIKKQDKGFLKTVAPQGANVEVSPELLSAIGEVRDDQKPTSWALATFEEGNLKKPLIVVATGTGEIDEFIQNLDDGQVMYGLYRTGDTIDDIKTVKFVYIYWVGENVKPLTKGKVSAFAGPIEKVFSPAHVTLSFTNRYDLTPEVIRDKVTSSSGTKSFVK